jgi:hypothetical protein
MPEIELLWWAGCPSHDRARTQLRAALDDLGRHGVTIAEREVVTDDDAARERFVGSPTVRCDGADLFPPGADEPPALGCRVYRLRDGRFSPVPDPGDLRRALLAAFTPDPRPST